MSLSLQCHRHRYHQPIYPPRVRPPVTLRVIINPLNFQNHQVQLHCGFFLAAKAHTASQHTQLSAAVILQWAPVAPRLRSSIHPPTYSSIQFYAPQFFRTSHRSFDPSLQASLVSAALRASLYYIVRLFFSTTLLPLHLRGCRRFSPLFSWPSALQPPHSPNYSSTSHQII